MVLPGQCLYTSPISKSSKYLPNRLASPTPSSAHQRKAIGERAEDLPLVVRQLAATGPGLDEVDDVPLEVAGWFLAEQSFQGLVDDRGRSVGAPPLPAE